MGWTDGRNVQIDYRFASGDSDSLRKYAAELVALVPDVILAGGAASVPSILQATRTVPIVFTNVVDPVGAGFVDSMARPGANATGFIMLEYSLTAKWLELLKEIAPGVTRVGRETGSAGACTQGPISAIRDRAGGKLGSRRGVAKV
jgi:putative tryptophan/tyrosine transport system substrate-binding protein